MSGKKQPFFPPPALPRTGVEAHAHIGGKYYLEDMDEVIERARAAGTAQIIQVFLSAAAYRNNIRRFDIHPDVFFCIGIHPIEAHEHEDAELDEIAAIIRGDSRIKAVGEIGLDRYWKDCPPERQVHMFRLQLKMAKTLGMPVVIHCRDAVEDTMHMLDEEDMTGRPLLWHCFGGDTALAMRIVDRGWHLSIPGPVTYPANQALRDAVAAVPLDRLLTETDCPYLTPVPLRGKRNEPANLGYTVEAMAKARNMPVEELWTACGDNARAFFKIPG